MENYLVITLLIVLDIVLWSAGFALTVSATNRFRLLSSAYVVLWLVLTAFLGWKTAACVSFGGLWIAAILVASGRWRVSFASQ